MQIKNDLLNERQKNWQNHGNSRQKSSNSGQNRGDIPS